MHTIVIGAGLVGLTTAWSLHRAGSRVTVIDPDPMNGATHAAAGMLAAVTESYYREEALGRLSLASQADYPAFVADVADVLGRSIEDIGYRRTRTLVVGADAADRGALTDLHTLRLGLGLDSKQLTTREARQLEPLLAPTISCAFLVEGDHQVDPRVFADAIVEALTKQADDAIVRGEVAAVTHANDDPVSAVAGVRLTDGRTVSADAVVVANGLGAGRLDGLGVDLAPALRPVHGDIMRLRPPRHLDGLVGGTIRGLALGRPAYLVPRRDGTVVLGATMREDDNPDVSAGGVYEVLRDAIRVVPAVAEFALLEVIARARPGTPDNAPLLGRLPAPGLVAATGTYRNGILLSPIVARAVTVLLGLGESIPTAGPLPELNPFDPTRFATVGARTGRATGIPTTEDQ